jgi:hypothetical protein
MNAPMPHGSGHCSVCPAWLPPNGAHSSRALRGRRSGAGRQSGNGKMRVRRPRRFLASLGTKNGAGFRSGCQVNSATSASHGYGEQNEFQVDEFLWPTLPRSIAQKEGSILQIKGKFSGRRTQFLYRNQEVVRTSRRKSWYTPPEVAVLRELYEDVLRLTYGQRPPPSPSGAAKVR